MTRECAVEFGGAGATRMCTSSEILNTATVPQGLVGEAWVRPSWQPFAAAEVAGSPQGLDDSGRYDNPTRLSCHGWSFGSNGNSYGLAVDGTGSFLNPSSCNTPLAIACCHPVVVPEPATATGFASSGANRNSGGRYRHGPLCAEPPARPTIQAGGEFTGA